MTRDAVHAFAQKELQPRVIQAALAERERSGKGQQIDMALLDVMVGTLANQDINYLALGISPKRQDNAHPNIAPYEVFPTVDGWFILAIGNDAQFRRFRDRMEIECDARFATNANHVAARTELNSMSKAHPRFKTPYIVTAITGSLVAVGAAFLTVGQLADISNAVTLYAFLMVAITVIVLRARDPGRKRYFRVSAIYPRRRCCSCESGAPSAARCISSTVGKQPVGSRHC